MKPGDTIKHKKRGSIYRVVGPAKIQTSRPLQDYDEVLVYRNVSDGLFWARPVEEFDDRFEVLQSEAPLSDRLPAAPAQPVAVTVKPLVWEDCEIENWDVFECLTILGRYKVQKFIDQDYALLVLPNGSIIRYPTIDAAKAAAQADYEARIMAALNVQPITVHDAAKVVAEAINSDVLTFNRALINISASETTPVCHFFAAALIAYADALRAIAEAENRT